MKARETRRPFSELLQYFAMERFLYRLSKSRYADNFVLKGALMLTVWEAPLTRPTMDIDLLGRIYNSIATIVELTREICRQGVEPDGIDFDIAKVEAERIAEDADYEGIRVRFRGSLDTARIVMQLDIGFGDIVIPSPEPASYPTLLDLPAPHLLVYSKESTIAEKFEAMVKLGILNSRLKDFYDIWFILRQFDFEGPILSRAISKTFSTRGTNIQSEPVALTNSFAEDAGKAAQWRGFVRKNRLVDVPQNLVEVVAAIATFLTPIVEQLAAGRVFKATWKAPGPWRE
ncbi:MAG: nucleotidyl transferase AbiEii/AbiGii toxin family protein [Deltaproteobacteria bacterium]|nr:nucleotidyl transferase AbiEii/AbiGii toxin family protein [Deltaproteobacteria bacterium]